MKKQKNIVKKEAKKTVPVKKIKPIIKYRVARPLIYQGKPYNSGDFIENIDNNSADFIKYKIKRWIFPVLIDGLKVRLATPKDIIDLGK